MVDIFTELFPLRNFSKKPVRRPKSSFLGNTVAETLKKRYIRIDVSKKSTNQATH
jgi:hypothetical protein